jgi:hypothetical protein
LWEKERESFIWFLGILELCERVYMIRVWRVLERNIERERESGHEMK